MMLKSGSGIKRIPANRGGSDAVVSMSTEGMGGERTDATRPSRRRDSGRVRGR
ncbi:MAG: hypothetical protein RLZZ232_7 [Planctomycetota bacterium]|jgi:hypothetical protein